MGKFLEQFHFNGSLKRPPVFMLLFSALFVLVAASELTGPALVRHPYLQLPGASQMTIVWANSSPGTPSVRYGVHWTDLGFDDSGWRSGPVSRDYGDGDAVAVLSESKDADLAYYSRYTFTLQDPECVERIVLSMGHDNGTVAYLNGVEVARPIVGKKGSAHQKSARIPNEAPQRDAGFPSIEEVDITGLKHLLVPGENVVAVRTLNGGPDGPDPSLVIYAPAPVAAIKMDAQWRYFNGSHEPLVQGQVTQGVSTYFPEMGGYYQHEVTVTGLEPATRYSYRIYLDDTEFSPDNNLSFQTAPNTPYFSFVAFGDSGTGAADQLKTREQLLGEQFDLAVLTGDIAYEDGTYAEFQRNYFDIYRDLLQRVPFVPASGNHEYFTDSAQPYLDLFVLPRNGAPGQEERYFSFDYANVHFVALDTERVDQAQVDWLKSDLEVSTQFWTVVYLHRPPFGEGSKHPAGGPEHTQVRASFAPVFEKYKVDLVLSGHNHMYGRSVPLINAQAGPPYARTSTLEDGGVVYVTTGGGGGHLYQAYTDGFHQPPGTAFSEHHYTKVTVADCVLALEAIDKWGQVRDQFNIDRCTE